MDSDLNIILIVFAALSPVLLAFLAAIGWLYRHERERREDVERQVSEHKYKAYMALLDIFFDAMKTTKTGGSINEDELFDRMFNANKEIVLYGSDDVVRIYQKWLGDTRKGILNLAPFGELIVAIRRDMGYPRTEISADEVLRQFITDYDDVKAKDKLIGKSSHDSGAL